jgi:hypothetical protein
MSDRNGKPLRINGATLPNGMQADAPTFDQGAGISHVQLVAIEEGAVQFRARRMLALHDDVLTVPFSVLFHLSGQLLHILASDTDAGRALRAHIGGAELARVPLGAKVRPQ